MGMTLRAGAGETAQASPRLKDRVVPGPLDDHRLVVRRVIQTEHIRRCRLATNRSAVEDVCVDLGVTTTLASAVFPARVRELC